MDTYSNSLNVDRKDDAEERISTLLKEFNYELGARPTEYECGILGREILKLVLRDFRPDLFDGTDGHLTTMLELSTSHITKETSEFLTEQAHANRISLIVYDKGGYGYFLPIINREDRQEKTLPDDLRIVLDYAWKNGCSWLMLDSDSPKIDELPQYEW